MSKELDQQQLQPLHGLAFMRSRFGKGGVPALDFFKHVFNMDEAETLQFFKDQHYDIDAAVNDLADSAIASINRNAEESFLSMRDMPDPPGAMKWIDEDA